MIKDNTKVLLLAGMIMFLLALPFTALAIDTSGSADSSTSTISEPATSSSGGTSSKSSSAAKSSTASSKTTSSKKSTGGGTNKTSNSHISGYTDSAAGLGGNLTIASDSASLTVNNTPVKKNITDVSKTLQKWMFIPIILMGASVFVLFSVNYKAYAQRKGAATRRQNESGRSGGPRRERAPTRNGANRPSGNYRKGPPRRF